MPFTYLMLNKIPMEDGFDILETITYWNILWIVFRKIHTGFIHELLMFTIGIFLYGQFMELL